MNRVLEVLLGPEVELVCDLQFEFTDPKFGFIDPEYNSDRIGERAPVV